MKIKDKKYDLEDDNGPEKMSVSLTWNIMYKVFWLAECDSDFKFTPTHSNFREMA